MRVFEWLDRTGAPAVLSPYIAQGNAGAATLVIDGSRVRTGAPGQPVRLSFAWKRGRAVPVA